jgi:hypothetical protein
MEVSKPSQIVQVAMLRSAVVNKSGCRLEDSMFIQLPSLYAHCFAADGKVNTEMQSESGRA